MGANFDLIKYGGFKNDYQATFTKDEGKSGVSSQVDPWGTLAKAAGGAKPPPDAPDMTDDVIRQRRAAEMNRLMLGYGRKSTFTEGGMGDLRLGTKSLTGGT